MDLLTHALTAALLACTFNIPQLMPFLVLGAVIADSDILFAGISGGSPPLYLFIHGGITHSIAGAVLLSVIAWISAVFVLATGLVQSAEVPAISISFVAVLCGTLLHIGLDSLAVPGVPLLAPFSDRKFTASLLPGPSLVLMAASLVFLISTGFGVIDPASAIVPYAAVLSAYLAVRLIAFFLARAALRRKGRAVPMMNPIRWLVIGETPDAWAVGEYRIGKGMGITQRVMKFRSTNLGETEHLCTLPEVRRLRFHSYIVTAERVGEEIFFSDPLRESGRIFYPPHYKRVRVRLPVLSGSAPSSSSPTPRP